MALRPPAVASRRALHAAAAFSTAAAVAVLAAVVPASPAQAWDPPGPDPTDPTESIQSYDVRIGVRADGAIGVTERIRYDFGAQPRHGIVRRIPVRSRYDRDRDRTNPISGLSVTATGASARTDVSMDGDDEVVRIGDPDRTVTEPHVYTLRYTVRGTLSPSGGGSAELAWNAVGTEWTVRIARAAVTVTAPAAPLALSCLTGPPGSRDPCATATAEGTPASFGQGDLPPGYGVTVRLTYPAGSVHGLGPILAERHRLTAAFRATTGTVGGALALALLGLLVAAGIGRFASGATADADRTAPGAEELRGLASPAEAGVLWDGRLHTRQLVATLVDLGTRGHLRIREMGGQGTLRWSQDWEVVRRADADPGFARHERALFDALFADADRVRLSRLELPTAGPRIRSYWQALGADVDARGWYGRGAGDGGSRHELLRVALPALLASVAATVLLAEFTHLALVGLGLVVGALALLAAALARPLPTARGRAARARLAVLRRHLRSGGGPDDPRDLGRYEPYAVALDVALLPDAGDGTGRLAWYAGRAGVPAAATAVDDYRRSLARFMAHAVAVRSVGPYWSPGGTAGHGGPSGHGSSAGWTGGGGVDGGSGVGSGSGGGGGGSW